MTAAISLLYAEDSPTDVDLTREYFGRHAPDFTLHVVGSGGACLAQLQTGGYDILLLDYRLPDMDAAAILQRAAEWKESLPVVVTTSIGDEDLVVQLLRLGAWDYVPKDTAYYERLPAILRDAVTEYRSNGLRARAARRQPRRILYVERHAADIDLTRKHFAEHAGHLSMEVSGSTREALERLRVHDFDLVMTDLRMPDANALDLLREMRAAGMKIPVIVVTGRGDELAAMAALRLGAYDYVVKRADYVVQLPNVVENAIDRFQLARLSGRLETELRERERVDADRLRLAEDLRQSQKLESLGRLAGGVAHDFNNLLTVVLGHTELILQDVRAGDPLAESVSEIRGAATRAVELTRSLLAFGRRQVLHLRVLDVNDVVRESAKMLSRLLGSDIALVTTLDPALGHVKADRSQLDQVVINLAINARDAMPRGGTLTIASRNTFVAENEALSHPTCQAGMYVELSFTDTGVGMDRTTLSQIFEPFFTTKRVGEGTGLGLAMVYGIIKQSDGWIVADSEPGRGTTFTIYLPHVAVPVSHTSTPPQTDSPRGHETVLLVEDEAPVRKLACHALRRLGYRVTEAANGGEALIACERAAEPFAILVTDVVMPGISGPELVERLTRERPGMKVLFMSGYTQAAAIRHGVQQNSVAFLQKPFTPAELGRKVREVLDDK